MEDQTTVEKRSPGRPKGAKNKVSAEIRDLLSTFCKENLPQIMEDFRGLKPKDRVALFVDILPFVVSKLSTQDSHISFESLSDDDINTIVNELLNRSNAGEENSHLEETE